MKEWICSGLLLLLTLLPTGVAAQSRVQLVGTVKDTHGMPLAAVAIAVADGTQGTYTDEQGRYSLSLAPGRYVLVASSLGYETVRATVTLSGSRQFHHFTLRENSVALGAVDVYGKTKSQQAKEGIFSVNALEVKPLINAVGNLNEIVNRTSGIRVREEGGVGSDFDLSINGLSGNSVRYFLDGMPLDAKGSAVNLANLPVNLIDRIEIYKGVVPASLGSDALGGAINIITHQAKQDYLDLSYGIGSFHTHRADLNAQYVERHTGLLIRPLLGVNYSKNDYMMKGVEVWDEASQRYTPVNRRRFHDDYLSLLGQLEVGFADRPWADAFFVSASYSKVNKELQTGSVQSRVYGMAHRDAGAWNLSARYRKQALFTKGLQLNASLSHTWDHSQTVDTAYRKYDWNGNYITGSRNEITGRGRSIRNYKRPLTLIRANLDYAIGQQHALNLNYLLSRTGNKQYDEVDKTFEPSNDVLAKHILGLAYNQSLFDGRLMNTAFLKDYVNHLHIRQKDLYWITGSEENQGSATKNYVGYGIGSRFTFREWLALKASFEHSVRLPLARELLGNGSTIYANVALRPENSDNLNLGLFGTWRPAAGHTLYYEAGGFIRNVDDFIQAQISEKEGMMQYTNVPAVHIKGVEGELRYQWQERLQLTGNMSWQDARDQQRYKTDGKPSATYKNRVPNRPWLFSSAEVSYIFRNLLLPQSRLRLSYNYQWVHWFFLSWEAYGALETKARIPTQHLSGLSATYSWKGDRYNISLECTNLFDAKAYDNYKLQKPGRALFAKFRLFLD